MTGRTEPELTSKLRELLNCYCAENGCNTPDYILAGYLIDCLKAFDAAVNIRERWYGREVKRLSGPFDPPTEPQGFPVDASDEG
jgi:hypothetical protein